ncbi:type IX secretion system membrane protein, PorP/SprF family [Catalinimonas alkaloidigena]|uniref:Type IX secretion system membrane protein, PorP/SprF family n=1 Tax=Catalinimonas alkaloidigena TaxID=1075417 RepID=A0A1G9MNS1_9BACT|nr:type IX secretion system membrane protein PorP/SprF [Catalinimonas alkaloidigena]SDL75681.1 type IX secretion system membrane protein, PorP/SprF family [Catalinimonas alkaloidigena]
MKKTFTLLLLVLLTGKVLAQQDEHFSHYMFNSFVLNPGYAGLAGAGEFVLVSRAQWLGYGGIGEGAPSTTAASFNMPILSLNSGAGAHFIHDRLGATVINRFYASYAYHFVIGKGKLGFGGRAGVYNMGVDGTLYVPPTPGEDPAIPSGSESQYRPDFDLGAWYATEKYYVGATVAHLMRSQFNLNTELAVNPLEHHAYLTGGYVFKPTYALTVTPSAIFKYEFARGEYQFEVSTLANYNEKFWGGLSYREGDAITALVGISALKENQLRFSYAFDYTITGQDGKKPTSHEVMLSYRLPRPEAGRKPIVRTPRFRH